MTKIKLLRYRLNLDCKHVPYSGIISLLNPLPSFQEAREWIEKNGFVFPGFIYGKKPDYYNAYTNAAGTLLYPPEVPERFRKFLTSSNGFIDGYWESIDGGEWSNTWTNENHRRWGLIAENLPRK